MIESPGETLLKIAARRGNIGASRDDLFRELKGGIPYNKLEWLVQELEQAGFITVDWLGTYDFVITITPEGNAQLT